MKNEQGFTVWELVLGIVGLSMCAASVYIIYLIVLALQKYIAT